MKDWIIAMLVLVAVTVLAFALASCEQPRLDPTTPKAECLSAGYEFYQYSDERGQRSACLPPQTKESP